MKKLTKITALAVAVIMLCLSLSGCASLDLKREMHANWTNEKGIDSITTSDGETYVLLDNEVANIIMYDTYLWNDVWVTDKDVPVLLSDSYGTNLSITSDKDFIYGYIEGTIDSDGVFCTLDIDGGTVPFIGGLSAYFIYTKEGTYPDKTSGKDVLYCKESIYDDIMSQIENGIEYTHYGYEYYVLDDEYTQVPKDYYLSKDEAKIIEKIFKEVKPKTNNEDIYEDYYNLTSLCHYSDDRNFGEYTCEVFSSYNYDEYIIGVYIESLDTYDCYKVPQKYLDDVKKIFKNAEKSNELMWADSEEVYY